jgi:hypothetical protein
MRTSLLRQHTEVKVLSHQQSSSLVEVFAAVAPGESPRNEKTQTKQQCHSEGQMRRTAVPLNNNDPTLFVKMQKKLKKSFNINFLQV